MIAKYAGDEKDRSTSRRSRVSQETPAGLRSKRLTTRNLANTIQTNIALKLPIH
jgi:hypothetical protein